MEKQEQIRQRLRDMVKKTSPHTTMLATVKSVDEGAFTCVLYDEETDLDYHDVRLRPVLDGKESITLVPKVNTWALAIRIEDTEEWMAIAFGEVDKLRLRANEVILNEGENGGIVNWPNAKTELDKVKELLTAIVNVLSGAPVPEPGNGSPSALQSALGSAIAGKQLPNFENLEDTSIKH